MRSDKVPRIPITGENHFPIDIERLCPMCFKLSFTPI